MRHRNPEQAFAALRAANRIAKMQYPAGTPNKKGGKFAPKGTTGASLTQHGMDAKQKDMADPSKMSDVKRLKKMLAEIQSRIKELGG